MLAPAELPDHSSMTAAENAALLRGGIILLVLSAARLAVNMGATPAAPIQGDDLPGLLAESQEALDEASQRTRPLEDDERIDPNTASEIELDRLPGVGPSTARAIVNYREVEGPFRGPEQLMSVRGIGPSTLRRIQAHLSFSTTETRVASGRVRRSPSTASRVSLNRATTEELVTLPGVGPALAARILQLRGERGYFTQIEDLLDVKGIGPALLGRVREKISIN